MKKILYITMTGAVFLLTSACTKVNTASNHADSSENTQTSNSEIPRAEILKSGYKIGEYRFKFMKVQIENDYSREDILSNLNVIIKNNFEKVEKNINKNIKIDLLPSVANYNPENKNLTINYFLLNNSSTAIESIHFKGITKFKDVNINKSVDTGFSKQEFITLEKNEFVFFSLTLKISDEYKDKLLENIKSTDLSIDITDLEINGQKTSNENQ